MGLLCFMWMENVRKDSICLVLLVFATFSTISDQNYCREIMNSLRFLQLILEDPYTQG